MVSESRIEEVPRVVFPKEELEPGTPLWAATRAQVVAALESLGCFEAVLEGFTPETCKAVFDAGRSLFALPTEAKVQNKTEHVYDGYLGSKPESPYESLSINNPEVPECMESFAKLMWVPEGNPSFSETACGFARLLAEFDKKVRKMVAEAFAIDEKSYQAHIDETHHCIRFSEYGPLVDKVSKEMIGGHTDWSTTTIIHQSAGGLEVMTEDGRWLPCKPSPNSFYYIVADSFQAWTNGRLKSGRHRVMVSGDDEESRYTAMVGSVPNYDVIVRAPEELINGDHPMQFKPFSYVDYMKFAASPAGHKAQADNRLLPTYCGVGVEAVAE